MTALTDEKNVSLTRDPTVSGDVRLEPWFREVVGDVWNTGTGKNESESEMTSSARTGAMIAAKLSDEDAQRIAVESGEPVNELHLTLLFLGPADAISEDAREKIIDEIVEAAGVAGPIRAELFGVSVFNPTGFAKKDGKDRDSCIVGLVGDPDGELTTLRGVVEEIFLGEPMGFEVPEQHSPWTPHVTLAYTEDTDVTPYVDRAGPVTFDGIRVAFGDDVYDIPLGEQADEMNESPAETDELLDVEVDDDGEIIVPNALLDLRAEVDAFRKEGKVRAPGVGHNLRNYWIHGKGAAKIRWGTEGSMKRCIRNLRKYVRDPGGLCATYHKVATGEWPRGGLIPSESEGTEEFGFLGRRRKGFEVVPNQDDVAAAGSKAADDKTITAALGTEATHAGLALVAADTGRVLMLQRSVRDESDPAAGTWEFPGGSIEPSEAPLDAAVREWQEEIGQPVPSRDVVDVWHSPNGRYRGFIVVTNSEDDLSMTDGRVVINPDDPDGDDSEQAAWWNVRDARDNPALREECAIGAGEHSPWGKLERVAESVVSTDETASLGEMTHHGALSNGDVLYDGDRATEGDDDVGRRLEMAVVTEPAQDGGCPDGYETLADGRCVKFVGAAESFAGGMPNPAPALDSPSDADDCPPGHHRMPDGECMPDSEMPGYEGETVEAGAVTDEYQVTPTWEGVLTVEGIESGDGRMFKPGSLTWNQPPLPLMWQKETSHGQGTNTSVRVGSITEIWREDDPTGRDGVKIIKGRGVIDVGGEDGAEVYRRMSANPPFLTTNSVDVDSIKDADVEMRYPETGGDDAPPTDGMRALFAPPELTVFNRGRIRATTLVEIPAFVEAQLALTDPNTTPVNAPGEKTDESATVTASAAPPHTVATTDVAWDPAGQESRLATRIPHALAGRMYAHLDASQIGEDGEAPKSAGRLPHHHVASDGSPGAANLTGCAAAIAALNGDGSRGGAAGMTNDERRAAYEHLAAHLRDAGREPPPLRDVAAEADALVAATHVMRIPDTPPREWFDEPTDVTPQGALTVTDEGRVYGYLAPLKVRHRSFPNQVKTTPIRNVDYSRFMGGETIVADGGRVVTGVITQNCGHATTDYQLTAAEAQEHYDNSCSLVASVRVGENKHGVWVAGALLPDVEPAQVQRIMNCRLSGDWRAHLDRPGWRELAAALLVPVPGFPMARSAPSVQVADGQLVASSVPVVFRRATFESQDRGNIDTPDAADLNTAARRYAASRGWAMSDGAYPIRPTDMHGETDLGKAIRAVGRGGAPHNKIRAHIMKRARALGKSDRIPEHWGSGGKVTTSSDRVEELRERISRSDRVAALRAQVTASAATDEAFHGTHNQKSHGNWAKPGARKKISGVSRIFKASSLKRGDKIKIGKQSRIVESVQPDTYDSNKVVVHHKNEVRDPGGKLVSESRSQTTVPKTHEFEPGE